LGALAGLTGAAAWLFAHIESDIKDAKLKRYQEDSGAKIAEAGAIAARANEGQAKANQIAAEANERMEELRKQNLELERQIQPRRISSQQETDITRSLEKWRLIEKCAVTLTVEAMDVEARVFMKQIGDVLRKCGFAVSEFPLLTLPKVGGPTAPPPPIFGLHILMSDPPPAGAEAILGALRDAQLQPIVVDKGSKRARVGIIDIEVGAKPLAN